jgi:hypothetical protein
MQLGPPEGLKLDYNSIFTGPSDAWWRAVRKGVAPAFSMPNLRYVVTPVRYKATSVPHK